MKKLVILILVLVMVPTVLGKVWVQIYGADGIPFDFNSGVMVGDKLVIIVISDSNDLWSGGLFVVGQDRLLGALAGRGLDPGLDPNDPNSRDYSGSHYGDAGDFAIVNEWKDSDMWGYDLYTFYPTDGYSKDDSTVPGNWFVIDYYANGVGDCSVGFYDYDISFFEPNYLITFSNVPTRDLNSDEVVDFRDFAIFSPQWNNSGCSDPDWCEGADINRDGDVDDNDLGLFVEYWLWPDSDNGQDEPDSPGDPNYPEDPNITYSIVDANGLGEITVDINDSVTLYVDIASSNDNNVWAFDIEVNISDPNLGSIDNTEYPDGTAQILAEPNKDPSWDFWGPGWWQEEGIRLSGATNGCAIGDGHLASFVFTCEGPGNVTLELIHAASFNTDHEEVFPKLEGIVIHQVDSQMMGAGGEMLSSQETTLSESPQEEVDIDELVNWLEDLWFLDQEIRKTYSRAEWNEFIDSVKNSY